MTRPRSVEPAEEVGEIAVAGLRCRRFERAAESGHDPGMGGRKVDLDDPSIVTAQVRPRTHIVLHLHCPVERASRGGSFVARGFAAISS